jgi:hypothetical protein
MSHYARKGILYRLGFNVHTHRIGVVIGAIITTHSMPNYSDEWTGIAWGIIEIIWVILWSAGSMVWMYRGYKYYPRNRWTWWVHDDALEIIREK